MSDVTVTVAFKPLNQKCKKCGKIIPRTRKQLCRRCRNIDNLKDTPNWEKHFERILKKRDEVYRGLA